MPFRYSECIIIAGGNDGTYDICKNIILQNFSKTIILEQKPRDYKSGALKKAIKRSQGQAIILVDADTILAPNFVNEAVKALEKFDVANCEYVPMLKKGIWYDFYMTKKIIWAKEPNDLSSLFGAATISLKKSTINKIGLENLFTSKTTAGVDHYMGLILKKNNIKIGLIKTSKVIAPRPGTLRDYIKDQKRWFNAFFAIHNNNKRLKITTLIINIMQVIVPFILILFNSQNIWRLHSKNQKKIRDLFTITSIEYITSLIVIKKVLEAFKFKKEFIGHFKGSRY